MTLSELEQTIVELEEEMAAAAEDLRFEYAPRSATRSATSSAIREAREHGPRPDRRAAGLTAAREARDLPHAHARPVPILVSEVMLQQTTGRARRPALRGVIERWPTAEALAAAPLADVLREWWARLQPPRGAAARGGAPRGGARLAGARAA